MALQFHADDDDQATLPVIGDKTASSHRRHMVAVGKNAYEPNKLPDGVFRKLNIKALSLLARFRPRQAFSVVVGRWQQYGAAGPACLHTF